jgi:hypothetical protein
MIDTMRSFSVNGNARGERKTMINETDDPFIIKESPIDTWGYIAKP